MAITIIRRQVLYHLIAECDLYLDETKSKVIVVEDGEEVPAEAAFVLAAKGGVIDPMYTKLVETMETPEPEVPAEPTPEPPQPLLEPVPDDGEEAPEVAVQASSQPRLLKPRVKKVHA